LRGRDWQAPAWTWRTSGFSSARPPERGCRL